MNYTRNTKTYQNVKRGQIIIKIQKVQKRTKNV